MPRDTNVYIDDILDSILKIEEYIKGMDFNAFASDAKTIDAVIRNLMIIGEAARHLQEHQSPDVEWRRIIGLRNILVHQYFGVNLQIIWDLITNKLQPLRAACEKLIAT